MAIKSVLGKIAKVKSTSFVPKGYLFLNDIAEI